MATVIAKGVVLLVLLASAPARARRANERNIEVLADDQQEEHQAAGALEDFDSWAQSHCRECGGLFGSLIRGIQDAGLVQSTQWDGATLTAVMTSGGGVFGEIASTSRVPVMWRLDQSLQIKFAPVDNGWKADVVGLHTEPSAQALTLYKEGLKEGNLDGSACGADMSCIEKEMSVVWKHMEKHWKKGLSIKKGNGKISKILMTTYNDFVIYAALKAAGAWPKTYYAMITAVPLTIDSFKFEGAAGAGLRVSATSKAHEEHPLAGEYKKLNLLEKSQLMGQKSLYDARNTMAMAEKSARSGINFAKMMSYGNPLVRPEMEKAKITAADVEAIENLFSRCVKQKGAEAVDPPCKGKDHGRVAWSSSPGEAMTAM